MPATWLNWLYLATAFAFEALIAGVLLAERFGRDALRDRLGRVWFLLALPLLLVGIGWAIVGRGASTWLWLSVPLLYMAVEWLLDKRLKYPFRDRWITHLPYILLEYAALLTLIRLGSPLGALARWLLWGGFWLVMAAVIATYVGRTDRHR